MLPVHACTTAGLRHEGPMPPQCSIVPCGSCCGPEDAGRRSMADYVAFSWGLFAGGRMVFSYVTAFVPLLIPTQDACPEVHLLLWPCMTTSSHVSFGLQIFADKTINAHGKAVVADLLVTMAIKRNDPAAAHKYLDSLGDDIKQIRTQQVKELEVWEPLPLAAH